MKINCKEASRLISSGLDKDIDPAYRNALRIHLALCDACNKLKAQFVFLRRAFSSFPGPEDRKDIDG